MSPSTTRDTAVKWTAYALACLLLLFGHEELTLDDLASVLDVADVIPLYRTCADWLLSEAFAKLQKVPNGPAAEAQR